MGTIHFKPLRPHSLVSRRTLSMFDEVPIFGLDATASIRVHWEGKDARGWIFLDRRPSVKPDIVASNEFLPFRNGTFREVFYDPPHFLHGGGLWFKSRMYAHYSGWKRRVDLIRNLVRVNVEFSRCLGPKGVLLVKWSDGRGSAVRWARALELLNNFELVKEQVRPARSGNPNNSKAIYATLRRNAVINA